MIDRRGILGAMAGAAAGGKQAVRMAASALKANPVPPTEPIGGFSWQNSLAHTNHQPLPPSGFDIGSHLRTLLADPETLKELRSAIAQEFKHISPEHLDWDLKQNKSYSMAAKIYYQRQRYIDNRIREHLWLGSENLSASNIVRDWFHKKTGFYL